MTESGEEHPKALEIILCRRCGEIQAPRELDRALWCTECRTAALKRATLRGWGVGVLITLLLALYIWFGIRPDLSLIPAAWAATLVVAFYLGSRVAREILYGTDRLRGRPIAKGVREVER